jgi:hypothetical protein
LAPNVYQRNKPIVAAAIRQAKKLPLIAAIGR